MIGPTVRFWLPVLSIAGTLSAVALLVVSSFRPGLILGEAATAAYVVSVLVALVSLSVLVWSLSAGSDTPSDGRPGAR